VRKRPNVYLECFSSWGRVSRNTDGDYFMVNKCAGLQLLVERMETAGQMEAVDALKATHAQCVADNPTVQELHDTLPPLLIRGLNFAGAMARHAASGFRRCSKKQISERLAICQACPHLVDNHCQLCGCACIETNQLMNKLALASEACPLGKWK